MVGRYSPPLGFESSPEERQRVVDALTAAEPDLVFVALGFPKQERLMQDLHERFPTAWFMGCGGAIDFIAGRRSRAPELVQLLARSEGGAKDAH